MILRLWHKLFGHNTTVVISVIEPDPSAQFEDFPHPDMFARAKFGYCEIACLCQCGTAAKIGLFGKKTAVEAAGVDAELAELRRISKL